MTPVMYWVVKRNSKLDPSVTKEVSHFTSAAEADTFSTSEFFQESYGQIGIVEKIACDIFDSAQEAIDNSTQALIKSAMSKLTRKELVAIGATHLVDAKPVDPAPAPVSPEEVVPVEKAE